MATEGPADLTRSGFGTTSVEWVPDPEASDVPRALSAFIHHSIAAYLRHRGITAKQLSAQVGGSRPGWTNKLNGIRPFSVSDLAALAFGTDSTVWSALPIEVSGPQDLLPANYIPLLSHSQLGQGMAQFVPPGVARAAARFTHWWRGEATAGREWALTVDVARQHAALELDDYGLPSSEASIGPGAGRVRTVEWVARSARLRLLWLWPDGAQTVSVADSLRAVGELIWAPPPEPAPSVDLVLLAAPPTVVHNLATALGLDVASHPLSTTLSLQAAHHLGLEGVDSELPDRTLTFHRWEPDVPIWLELKS